MIIHVRPKLKHVQNQVLDEVKRMMSGHFRTPGPATGRSGLKHEPKKPELVASCSTFGPKVCFHNQCSSACILLSRIIEFAYFPICWIFSSTV